MRRRAIVTTLFTALLAMSLSGLGVGVLQAQMVLYGPPTYTRTAGAPNQFTDTFTLPAGTTAPYTIHIVNLYWPGAPFLFHKMCCTADGTVR